MKETMKISETHQIDASGFTSGIDTRKPLDSDVYQMLHDDLRFPQYEAGSEIEIWEDELLAENLLAHHLNPDDGIASRNMGFVFRTSQWLNLICPHEQYRKVLDLGCGPGLYAMRLAKTGYRVTGIDLSGRSIAYAKEKSLAFGLDIHYVQDDYMKLGAFDQQDVVILINCHFGALSMENRGRLLKRVHDCLLPNGRLMLDVCTLAFYDACQEKQVYSVNESGFWYPGRHLLFETVHKYEHATLLNRNLVIAPGHRRAYNLWNHCFSAKGLLDEAEAAGFSLAGTFCDTFGSPFYEGARTLTMLLEK